MNDKRFNKCVGSGSDAFTSALKDTRTSSPKDVRHTRPGHLCSPHHHTRINTAQYLAIPVAAQLVLIITPPHSSLPRISHLCRYRCPRWTGDLGRYLNSSSPPPLVCPSVANTENVPETFAIGEFRIERHDLRAVQRHSQAASLSGHQNLGNPSPAVVELLDPRLQSYEWPRFSTDRYCCR